MGHVALAHDGRWFRLGEDPERRLTCVDAELDHAALFERAELGHGRIALLADDGRFLAVRPDPGLSYGVYPEEELTPRAAFEEIRWPDGQVSLRSCHLAYVSAEPSGQVTVNRTEPGTDERFLVVSPAVPTLPDQRRPARTPVAATPRG